MAIDTRYVAAEVLQQTIYDKTGSGALSGGYVYFYQDNSRTVLQDVYQLTGNAPNYSFSALPNPVRLSSIGSFMDNDGNDIIPYYLPYLIVDGEITTEQSLYYVVVQNQNFVPQFTREAWPPVSYSGGGGSGSIQTDFNYIPNGQFLAHDIIPANTITDIETAIAPGGFYFLINDSVSSANTVTFNHIGSWTENPPQSPQYEVEVNCTVANTSETYKAISIRFNDVNKFANQDDYTFGFAGRCESGSLEVSININKYFGQGGTVFIPETRKIVTLSSGTSFESIPINFGTNAGDAIGTGTTWVSIDIAFSTAATFDAFFTDFVLVAGDVTLGDFPAQTNADMITRGVYGWTDVPAYDGFSLYLSPVLTPYGMTWDTSTIGRVEMFAGNVTDPNSTSPIPLGNLMPCDGAPYITSTYSTLGIPFERIFNYLVSNSPVTNTPMYGTGLNYATAYSFSGIDSSLRLTVNSNGTGSTAASDFDTDWVVGSIVDYNGSSAGANTLHYTAYNTIADTVLAVSDFSIPNNAASAGTSPFTVTLIGGPTDYVDLLAQQDYAFTVLCTPASTLITGTTGLYFDFSNETGTGVDYRMWFNTGTETPPSAGGRELLGVVLDPSYTAQDVANVVREVINAFQISVIQIDGVPSPGTYWIFFSNPASPRRFNIWYSVDGEGSRPSATGAYIQVSLLSTDSNAQILEKTLTAINAFQFAAPDFRGMFFRAIDPNGTWDFGATQRWSSVTGLSGANVGTFEYSQFLAHVHTTNGFAAGDTFAGDFGHQEISSTTGLTGGSETRPVNTYITPAIRY